MPIQLSSWMYECIDRGEFEKAYRICKIGSRGKEKYTDFLWSVYVEDTAACEIALAQFEMAEGTETVNAAILKLQRAELRCRLVREELRRGKL